MISLFNNSFAPSVFNDNFFDNAFFDNRRSVRRPRTAAPRSFFSNDNLFSDDFFAMQPRRQPTRQRQRQPFDLLFDEMMIDAPRFNRNIQKKLYNGCQCENCNKENMVPQNQQLEKINEEQQTVNKPNYESKFFSRNFVNKNGNKTTIEKKCNTKNDKTETFVTKIFEDKDGNKEVTEIKPENYNNELKSIFEESDCVLQEVEVPEPFAIENKDDDKMNEEEINREVSDNSDGSGKNMFSNISF